MIALLLALTIAFPRVGQKLPHVERCYLLGAVGAGETNTLVAGRAVPVYSKTGAWATMVDCVEGTNTVDVAGSNIWFTVAPKPLPVPPSTNPPPAKVWKKLEYAGDEPKPHPTGTVFTVVLDPGHGGTDTGALSPHGIPEKDANLRMAKAVKAELVKRGVSVVMTREDDSFPALYDRPKVAHENGADAFVSIHHNAPPLDKDPNVFRYHTVYCWNEIGENLATPINRQMAIALGNLKNNGVQRANYAVTRNPEIPSCLIEVDFISNPEGEVDSWDPVRRRKVAAAIAEGILDWSRQQK